MGINLFYFFMLQLLDFDIIWKGFSFQEQLSFQIYNELISLLSYKSLVSKSFRKFVVKDLSKNVRNIIRF
jgi:hypothetical protein